MGAFADVEVVAASSEKPLFEHQLAIEWTDERKAVCAGIFPAFLDAFDTAEPFLPTVWVDGERTFGSSDSTVVFATTGGHTTRVERTQRQLRAGFTDRLVSDDANRFTDIHLITMSQIPAIAFPANAVHVQAVVS